MQLLENNYEKKLLLQLPPKARDVAETLLSSYSLAELLALWQQDQPDEKSLQRKQEIEVKDWYPILNAVILAKTTYFFINPDFTQDEVLYLIKAACASAGFPLTQYSLSEAIRLSEADFPVLNEWLVSMAKTLKSVKC